jgi:hypothetical protein
MKVAIVLKKITYRKIESAPCFLGENPNKLEIHCWIVDDLNGLASQQQPLSASNPDESRSQQFLELLIFFHWCWLVDALQKMASCSALSSSSSSSQQCTCLDLGCWVLKKNSSKNWAPPTGYWLLLENSPEGKWRQKWN